MFAALCLSLELSVFAKLSSQGKSLAGGWGTTKKGPCCRHWQATRCRNLGLLTCGMGFVKCLIFCFENGSRQRLDQDHRLVVSFYVPSPATFLTMKRPAAHMDEPAEEGRVAGLVHLRGAGLNARPEFADKLVDGVKDIECRKYPLGTRGTEACAFVIRTKGRQKHSCPAVIGLVEFVPRSRHYLHQAEFAADRHRRCVPKGSEFDWLGPEASPMYAWWVKSFSVLQSLFLWMVAGNFLLAA